jgi:uncharacterized protein
MNNMTKEQRELDFEDKYADANLFIYAAIDKEKIGKKAKTILSDVKSGKYKLFTATLTVDEFLWRVQEEAGRELAFRSANIFLTLANLELINVDAGVISESINIYQNDKLDPRDAIHLAAMKSKKLRKILSSDSDFDKVEGIKRIDFSKNF